MRVIQGRCYTPLFAPVPSLLVRSAKAVRARWPKTARVIPDYSMNIRNFMPLVGRTTFAGPRDPKVDESGRMYRVGFAALYQAEYPLPGDILFSDPDYRVHRQRRLHLESLCRRRSGLCPRLRRLPPAQPTGGYNPLNGISGGYRSSGRSCWARAYGG